MIGETLAQYRIEARLGSGGMGVVYRARDERLHRTVAIKLLDTSRSGSTPEQHARLLDEARAASALNHPNICTVFEVGEADARPFIAMEYVDGRPLANMVPHDGLPIETVVRYGVQIADALAHAHERGVVHRDLKSANIVINAAGDAKVLDFGLATRGEVRSSDTITRPVDAAAAGTLVGTLVYLPPEVLLGQPADARSDIWALGVVLFEMATGELPFRGLNQFDITAAILRSPPAPFPAHVPAMLRAIILHCLAKEPGQRYRQAGEVRAALEAMQSDMAACPVPIEPRVPTRAMVMATAAVVTVVTIVAVWMLFVRQRSDSWEQIAASGRLTRVLSSEERTFDPVLSPDGTMLCYVAENAQGRADLFVARIAGGARVRLTDDDAIEESPRFSPDGDRIAYTRRDGPNAVPDILVVPAFGGDAIAIIPRAAFPAWSPDGRSLAYVRRADAPKGATELTVGAPDGAGARMLLSSDGTYPFLRYPAWSPDGREIAIVRSAGGVAAEIWIVSSKGGAPRRVYDEPASIFSDAPAFTPDGRGIIHSSNRGGATNIWLFRLPSGTPLRLTTGPGPDDSPTVSANGTIAFEDSRWRDMLEVHDLTTGDIRTLVNEPLLLWAPAVSHDGKQIAFSRSDVDGIWHVWVVPTAGGTPRRLTSGDAGELYPRWMPDDAAVLFHTWSTPHRIGRVPAGGGPPTLLSFGNNTNDGFADISPDGRRIALTRAEGQNERIYIGSTDGGGARLLTATPGAVARWSPDGRRIAFGANRGYLVGIFVIDADGTHERRLTAEGGWPAWFPDGDRIGYLAVDARGNQEIRVVRLDGSAPQPLGAVKLTGTNHPFSVTPDGRSIVVSNAAHVSDEIWLLQPAK
jgi:Tol biopolymer transport system component/tRNA A-37 threonylcarbamoyl transferase component Bud32